MLESHSVPDKAAEGSFHLTPGLYILGRQPNESDLVCQHVSISRKHAEITVESHSEPEQGPLLHLKGTLSCMQPMSTFFKSKFFMIIILACSTVCNCRKVLLRYNVV